MNNLLIKNVKNVNIYALKLNSDLVYSKQLSYLPIRKKSRNTLGLYLNM